VTEQLPLEPRYIGRPYAKGHPTSQGAALGDRSKMRAKVYEVIRDFGSCTDGEVANQLGVDSNSTRPRRLELQRAGMIVAAGRKPTRSGRSATAWRVPAGDDA
jgi:predicted ArsR family transcriptional regulator